MNRTLMTRLARAGRAFTPWAILLCFLALALVTLAVSRTLSAEALRERGVARGYTAAAAFTTDDNPVGINATLDDVSSSTLERSISLIKAGGFGRVRQRFPWREIEPSRGLYQWSKWDKLVNAYAAAGLQIVAVLDQPPAWSRQDNNWINRPPDSYADYADFVRAFVARYRRSVGYVEIWDEPNIFPNWGNRAVDPADYVKLLKVAYVAAKAADPNVKVLTAGLAPNVEPGGRDMADTLFLEAMYRAGAKGFFDILAAKPYGFASPPDDRRVDDRILNLSRIIRLHEIMVANGDESKPVWAVEFGWNALPPEWSGPPSPWGQVSEAQQADYTTRAIARARQEWPWLQGMLVQGFDPREFPTNPLYGFSVVDNNLQPRPVYAAVQRATGGPQLAPVGRHSANSRYVQYIGSWRTSADGRLGAIGDAVTIPFEGTQLDALVWRSPSSGAIRVTIDGNKPSLSPDLDSHATADLFSPIAHQAKLTLASGLTDGPHVADLRVIAGSQPAGAGNGALIRAFVVVRDAPFTLDPALIALWLALIAGAVVGLAHAAPAFHRAVWPPLLRAIRRLSKRLATPPDRLIARWERAIGDLSSERVVAAMAIALALFYFVSSVPIALGALLVFALLAWARPDLALLFVVFATPFVGLPKEFGHVQFTMVEILVLLIAAVTLLKHILNLAAGNRAASLLGSILADPFAPAAGLFLIASLISLIGAERLHEGLRELRTVVVEPMLFYWLLVSALNRRKVVWLPNTLILAAVAACSIGLYQYLFKGDVITAEGVFRMRAFYGSPNNLGLFLGRIIPFVLSLGILGTRNTRARLLYLGAGSLLIISLILTFSTGAWLGTAVAVLLMLALENVTVFGIAATGTAGAAVLLPQMIRLQRFTSRFDFAKGTVAMRLMIWQAASNMLANHPLLGVGLDNFLYHYPHYMLPGAWREPDLSHPHNIILDFWLSTGLLGLAAATWLIARFFIGAVRVYRRTEDVRSRALALGLLGSMTDFLTHGMIDNAYFTIDLAIIFWTSLAAVRLLEGEREQA